MARPVSGVHHAFAPIIVSLPNTQYNHIHGVFLQTFIESLVLAFSWFLRPVSQSIQSLFIAISREKSTTYFLLHSLANFFFEFIITICCSLFLIQQWQFIHTIHGSGLTCAWAARCCSPRRSRRTRREHTVPAFVGGVPALPVRPRPRAGTYWSSREGLRGTAARGRRGYRARVPPMTGRLRSWWWGLGWAAALSRVTWRPWNRCSSSSRSCRIRWSFGTSGRVGGCNPGTGRWDPSVPCCGAGRPGGRGASWGSRWACSRSWGTCRDPPVARARRGSSPGARTCPFSWGFSSCVAAGTCNPGVPSCARRAVASLRRWTAASRSRTAVSTRRPVVCWSPSCAFSGFPAPSCAVVPGTTPWTRSWVASLGCRRRPVPACSRRSGPRCRTGCWGRTCSSAARFAPEARFVRGAAWRPWCWGRSPCPEIRSKPWFYHSPVPCSMNSIYWWWRRATQNNTKTVNGFHSKEWR